jgi:hypothetical protein
MKKTLLTLLLCSTFSFAQVLESENFNALTIGNVGTDITGATPGQGSWLTFSTNGADPTTSTNAANSNFQIVASGNSSTQGLLIQGPNGDKGSRFMWKSGFETAWAGRTFGNDIVEVEYDFFTGPATTSTAQSGIRLYGIDGATSRVLCGYVYNSNTRILQGVAYLDNGGTFGTFLITLQTGGLILDANTWYRIGFGYDTLTGEPYWKFDSNPSVSVNPANFAGPFAPIEVDFVMAVPATNTTSADMTFDNYVARATNDDTLLNTALIETAENTVSIYPNPAFDVVNVSITNSNGTVAIEKASITDINGRIIKNLTSVTNNQINVSDLNSGIYFLNIETNEGKTVKKFIKN